MEVEFMTADTALPPCMPLPRAVNANIKVSHLAGFRS